MKTTISFGKCDYHVIGRKTCEITVDIRLEPTKDGVLEFAASGAIWNSTHTDHLIGGQCFDTLAEFIKDNPLFDEIRDLWKHYHLNGLNPGTHRQEESCRAYFKRVGRKYDYAEACKHLKRVGLLTDDLAEGESVSGYPEKRNGYKYGSGWIAYTIPSEVIERMKSVIEWHEVLERDAA